MNKKFSSKKYAIVAFLLMATMASMAFLAPAFAQRRVRQHRIRICQRL